MSQAANYLHCAELLDLMFMTVANLIKGRKLSHTGTSVATFMLVDDSPLSRLTVSLYRHSE